MLPLVNRLLEIFREWLIFAGSFFCSFDCLIFSTKTGQGWGITTDGESLIVSDGSEFLFFWDPDTMKETRRVKVKNASAPFLELGAGPTSRVEQSRHRQPLDETRYCTRSGDTRNSIRPEPRRMGTEEPFGVPQRSVTVLLKRKTVGGNVARPCSSGHAVQPGLLGEGVCPECGRCEEFYVWTV